VKSSFIVFATGGSAVVVNAYAALADLKLAAGHDIEETYD
jgi:hypothetical protein